MNHQNRINSGGTEATANVRADRLAALLGAAPANTDHAAVRAYMHDLADAGCALLLIYPGSKMPADPRTPAQRRAEDKAAQAAGRKKSKDGLDLATTDNAVLDGYLDRYIRFHSAWADAEGNEVTWNRESEDAGEITLTAPVAVNLAVETGRSRIVVVDADTPEQVAAFSAAGYAGAGQDADTPTVSTPGVRNAETGDWTHSDGGHWWFTVPEDVELPTERGALTLGVEHGYAVLWRQRYVLIPPSTRPEGPYKATGTVAQLPEGLAEQITEAAQGWAQRAASSRARVDSSRDPIAALGATLPWSEILAPTGWEATGKADGCGCETWTAPGPHSPKSATAHEFGCAVHPDSLDPCLHIWTDHDIEPFGQMVAEHGSHLTRLRAVAAIHYDNDLGAAMDALKDAAEVNPLAMSKDMLAMAGVVAGKDGDNDDDGASTGEGNAPTACYYPPEFWESRESLRHLRDAALARRAAPDAALVAVMARLAAHIPPSVKADTGTASPVSLNLFAAPTSRSGRGKTTAIKVSKRVVILKPGWTTDPNNDDSGPVLLPMGEPFPREGKIRSGEGIAEQYWGTVEVPNPRGGRPKQVRRIVRSNVLMTTDEGSGLIKHITDPKQTVGETIREAFNASAIGQSNADEGRYRFVPDDTYALGVIVGFQLSVMVDMLTADELGKGTPQRFLFAWCKPDPNTVTREMLAALIDPGPLTVTVPHTGLRLCESLRAKADDEHLDGWLCDDADDDTPPLLSQRLAMVARLAGHLAILDGRTETDELGLLVITEQDWWLAETMFNTSCAIADLAMSENRKHRAHVRRAQHARDLAEAIEDDEARSTPVGRAKARILGYLHDLGPGEHRWSGKAGIVRRFNQADASDAETALMELAREGGRVKVATRSRGSRFVTLVG